MQKFSVLLVLLVLVIGCRKETAPADEYITLTKVSSRLPYIGDHLELKQVGGPLPELARDIFFTNASKGYLTTEHGKIYSSSDSGQTWTLSHSIGNNNLPLESILFVDDNIEYAAGGSLFCGGSGCVPPGGLILKTTDGGQNWQQVYARADMEFVSLILSGTKLFAIGQGTKGALFNSDLGLENWALVDSFGFRLYTMDFEAGTGYCGGQFGNLLKSTDNGKSWVLTSAVPSGNIWDLKFYNGTGYAIGSGNIISKIVPGQEWQSVFGSEFSTNALHLTSADHCLAFGSGSYSGGDFGQWRAAVRQTLNGGKHWKDIELIDSKPIRTVHFHSPKEGYCLSGGYDGKLISVRIK